MLGELLEAYLASLPEDRRILLRRYRVVDVVRKVVGVGSVGTRCWVILLTGADDDDPLFLQVKEAQPSVLAPLHFTSEDDSGSQGRRVVQGQRLIQGSPDIFLGWCRAQGTPLLRAPAAGHEGGIDITPGMVRPRHFVEYCQLCGWALALAHARVGDAARIAGYLASPDVMDEAIAEFAVPMASVPGRITAACRPPSPSANCRWPARPGERFPSPWPSPGGRGTDRGCVEVRPEIGQIAEELESWSLEPFCLGVSVAPQFSTGTLIRPSPAGEGLGMRGSGHCNDSLINASTASIRPCTSLFHTRITRNPRDPDRPFWRRHTVGIPAGYAASRRLLSPTVAPDR